ncbi:MAG: FMN-binding protein [Sulfurimonas sp.]|jgi:Na+-translocating ferredoxin:NAD+ oxidoreductase RnfG subunit|nr:FMN-binding protein [Sulfurimonas sp.]MBU3939664.1 FMN-binding protein [bacterium]MBU4025383.1 FMN-binding protein [bacterium]MBU4058130.1 FMN-binding protein [bacterium]MBU4111142.1 FMN-binding protein [bacterium]
MKTTAFLILFALSLSADILISPQEAMALAYKDATQITKKNILLTNEQTQKIQEEAKVKLSTKIYRVFKAQKEDKVLGYGILINETVRSKNAVILYFISHDSILKGIEIIAFNEPPEYLPSKEWSSQFQNIETTKMLRISKEIPTITGATMSARSVTDGSRVAFALYNQLLKD